ADHRRRRGRRGHHRAVRLERDGTDARRGAGMTVPDPAASTGEPRRPRRGHRWAQPTEGRDDRARPGRGRRGTATAAAGPAGGHSRRRAGMPVPDRLRAPALAPVWRAVHDRLSSGRAVTRVRIGPLTAEEQGALADLLGLDRLPGEYYQLPISRLDAVLAEITGLPTGPVVVALLGPLDDRAGQRTKAAAERAELWRRPARHPRVRRPTPP